MQDSHPDQGSILLIIDALRPSMLGPYGNTWFDTPALNRLASESMVYEQCIADTPEPTAGLTNLVTGRHFCQSGESDLSLMDSIGSANSILVTTDTDCLPDVYDRFDQVIEVELPTVAGLASDMETTQLATFFAAAIQEIGKVDSNSFVLLYCGSLATDWDAPFPIRMQLADDDDPEPSKTFSAISQQFNVNVDDPDQLLDCQVAYGAQIVVLDKLLEIFLDQVATNPSTQNSLVGMTSLRGYPLGEHGVVGFYRNQLFNESLHVPLMIRFPDASHRGRSQRLVQPGSLFEFLSSWHGQKQTGCLPELVADELRPDFTTSAVVSGMMCDSKPQHAIQTQSWKLIVGNSKQLFVRPDDLWEYNDVAELCSEIVGELETELLKATKQLASGQKLSLELSSELAFGVE